MALNVLILAGKADTGGEEHPIYLQEFKDQTVLERVIASAQSLSPCRVTLVAPAAQIRTYNLSEVLRLLCPVAHALPLRGATAGAACTALLAVDHIDNDDELLILGANEWLESPLPPLLEQLREAGADAGVLSFRSIHPRFAYVRTATSSDGCEPAQVLQSSEKRPISATAIAGVYWFRRGRDFVEAAKAMIQKGAHVNGEFFVAPALNELILKQKSVLALPLPDLKAYHPLKTAERVRHEQALEFAR